MRRPLGRLPPAKGLAWVLAAACGASSAQALSPPSLDPPALPDAGLLNPGFVIARAKAKALAAVRRGDGLPPGTVQDGAGNVSVFAPVHGDLIVTPTSTGKKK